MRNFFNVLIGLGLLWGHTAIAADDAVIVDADLDDCAREQLSYQGSATLKTFEEVSAQKILAACLKVQTDNAITAQDLTRMRDLWITVSSVPFDENVFAEHAAFQEQLEVEGWKALKAGIDAALEEKDVAEAETLIQGARISFHERLALEEGAREGAGRFDLSAGTLWTEYRHGQDRLLLRMHGTFKGETRPDPCLRLTDVAVLDQSKQAFRKGKNIRQRGGNPGVGVGGAIGGGSRSGVGGGVGVSIDLTPLFGGGGDGRIARIFRMDGAQGATKSWTVVGTFRNHCDRTKETFSVPLVPEPDQTAETASDLAAPPIE